jgi:hypothetical protein
MVEESSGTFQMMSSTQLVIKRGMKAGKVQFSQVQFIEKGLELVSASGITSRLVPPDGL